MSAKFETLEVHLVPIENVKLFINPYTEGFCSYKDVLVFFDDDLDTRIFDFIDGLSDHRRNNLYAVGEHEGSLSMVWRCKPPKGMQEDDHVEVCGDVWSIFQSVQCVSARLVAKRSVPSPFKPIGDKVCVVRGDAFMIRQWLSMVGFSFDAEAKAWTQTVQVDAMGRGKFQFKHRDKFEIWDLSDLVDACPRWETSRNLSVSFE